MALASLDRERQICTSRKPIITPISRFSTAGGAGIISTGSVKLEAGLCSPHTAKRRRENSISGRKPPVAGRPVG